MNAKHKFETAFGKVETSSWIEAAEKWKQELPWKSYAQQIALEILEYLDKEDISQKKFAEMMGVSPQLTNKWLKGDVNFTLETISKMETILGITLIQVSNLVEPSSMVMAVLKPIHVPYQKPENITEEHTQKTSKVIKLNNDYSEFSIAN